MKKIKVLNNLGQTSKTQLANINCQDKRTSGKKKSETNTHLRKNFSVYSKK